MRSAVLAAVALLAVASFVAASDDPTEKLPGVSDLSAYHEGHLTPQF